MYADLRERSAAALVELDLPGYAVVKVNGPRVTATVYSGVGRQAWRTLALSDLLAS